MTFSKSSAESETSQTVEPVVFRAADRPQEDELDMTPMVDVTFLLLIFFMVTAAYSLQKAKPVPTPEQTESSAQSVTLQEIEEDDDYVIVEIRGDDMVFVDEVAAPGEQELILRLREAREGSGNSPGASKLLVLANRRCRYETVVMALDAGNEVGMESVRLTTAEEEVY